MKTLYEADWERNTWVNYVVWCYRESHLPEPHDHTFYELFWVTSGQGRYWINGKVEALKPGDLVLVRPEDAHSFAAERAGEFVEFVNVAFLSRVWLELQGRYFKRRAVFFASRPVDSRRHRLTAAQLSRMDALAAGLKAGAKDRISAEAFVLGVLAMLVEPPVSPREDGVPHWLAHALEQVRFFPNFAGGPAALARLAGRSSEHVARECRRCLGRKPSDIVNEARMEYAAGELRSDRKSIVDVALECGIENLGHFYQLFRKRHSLSPALYRRQFLKVPRRKVG